MPSHLIIWTYFYNLQSDNHHTCGIFSIIISGIYLDNLLHRDDVSSVPQADRLLWGETLEALLHHLQTKIIIIIIVVIFIIIMITFFSTVDIFTALTSLKSLCSMKIVLVNGTVWLPLASLAGKSGTFTSGWRKQGQ